MKNKITLLKTLLSNDNKVEYFLKIEGDVKRFFNDVNLSIEYFHEEISNIPEGILNIPLLTNILPIIWLTDSEFYIENLDESFINSISEIKKGYEEMYPETKFKGKIFIKNIIDYKYEVIKNRACSFFSGGVDSFATLISNLDKKPDLITLWGSDIKVNNYEGWANVEREVRKVGEDLNLKNLVIKSTFRNFIKEGELDKEFSKRLKDGWWHGIQHGIGLIGHAVPYAYKYKLEKIFIPSTHTHGSGKIRCASYPTIDEKVKYASGIVIHEGFENSRQKKIEIISNHIKKTEEDLLIRVCWMGATGKNCSNCEKCSRTIMGLLAEGLDPNKYGFIMTKETLRAIKKMWYNTLILPITTIGLWNEIQRKFLENKNKTDKDLNWILKINFKKQSDKNKRKIKLKQFFINKKIRLCEITKKIVGLKNGIN